MTVLPVFSILIRSLHHLLSTFFGGLNENLGLTQRVLAEKMNCTQQYVSKVLKGRENLSLETLCKIENALGIKILQARINK